MTLRYVGSGGSDASAGTSWATRKLTLNGVEDTPVVAGDTIYVGPGVYRELLTCDVSGTAGNPITYIGDVTGEHTDSIGGIVRITGSDNDQAETRAYCIHTSTRDYRTFRGFALDAWTTYGIYGNATNDLIVEYCTFSQSAARGIYLDATTTASIVRNCLFFGIAHSAIADDSTGATNSGVTVRNCLMWGGALAWGAGVQANKGGATIRNCSFIGWNIGIRVNAAIDAGQEVAVNNCCFLGCDVGMHSTNAAYQNENYNSFSGNGVNRSGVTGGANSNTYLALLHHPLLLAGFLLPWQVGQLSQWSQVRAIAGTGESIIDLFGIARPATAAKNSWGAVQYMPVVRNTGTVRSGSISLQFEDAGMRSFTLPVGASSTTVSAYVIRATSYSGSNPQLIIRQPGASVVSACDAGAASSWNQVSASLTPAGSPTWAKIELWSHNTAASSGSAVSVWWDDLTVT